MKNSAFESTKANNDLLLKAYGEQFDKQNIDYLHSLLKAKCETTKNSVNPSNQKRKNAPHHFRSSTMTIKPSLENNQLFMASKNTLVTTSNSTATQQLTTNESEILRAPNNSRIVQAEKFGNEKNRVETNKKIIRLQETNTNEKDEMNDTCVDAHSGYASLQSYHIDSENNSVQFINKTREIENGSIQFRRHVPTIEEKNDNNGKNMLEGKRTASQEHFILTQNKEQNTDCKTIKQWEKTFDTSVEKSKTSLTINIPSNNTQITEREDFLVNIKEALWYFESKNNSWSEKLDKSIITAASDSSKQEKLQAMVTQLGNEKIMLKQKLEKCETSIKTLQNENELLLSDVHELQVSEQEHLEIIQNYDNENKTLKKKNVKYKNIIQQLKKFCAKETLEKEHALLVLKQFISMQMKDKFNDPPDKVLDLKGKHSANQRSHLQLGINSLNHQQNLTKQKQYNISELLGKKISSSEEECEELQTEGNNLHSDESSENDPRFGYPNQNHNLDKLRTLLKNNETKREDYSSPNNFAKERNFSIPQIKPGYENSSQKNISVTSNRNTNQKITLHQNSNPNKLKYCQCSLS